jgi:hypothetical protein
MPGAMGVGGDGIIYGLLADDHCSTDRARGVRRNRHRKPLIPSCRGD